MFNLNVYAKSFRKDNREVTYKDVTWSSDIENVAKVENGVVKAIGKGIATITVKNIGGKTATCTVTVSSNG